MAHNPRRSFPAPTDHVSCRKRLPSLIGCCVCILEAAAAQNRQRRLLKLPGERANLMSPIPSSKLMKSKFIPIALTFAATTALAQAQFATPPAAKSFEVPGRVPTKMFIPSDVISGPLHSVGDFAENDGMNNAYFLYSGNDAWAVTTGIALRTRIREIYAIAKLREMSKTDEFAQAMANAGKQKIEGVVGIVTNPLGTIQKSSFGASRF